MAHVHLCLLYFIYSYKQNFTCVALNTINHNHMYNKKNTLKEIYTLKNIYIYYAPISIAVVTKYFQIIEAETCVSVV